MLGILAGSSVMLMPQGQGFVMYRNYCLLETRREREIERASDGVGVIDVSVLPTWLIFYQM